MPDPLISTAVARGANKTKLLVSIALVDTVIGLLEAIKLPKGTVVTERMEPLDADHTTPISVGQTNNDTSTFVVYMDPLDDTHSYLHAITNDATHASNGEQHSWSAQFPQVTNLRDWVYTGILESFELAVEKASLMKATGTIQVNESTQLPIYVAP